MPARCTEGLAAGRGAVARYYPREEGAAIVKPAARGNKSGICGKRRGCWAPRARLSATPPADGRDRGGLTRARPRDYSRLANQQRFRRSPFAPNQHRGISSAMAADSLSPCHRERALKVSHLDRVISTRAGAPASPPVFHAPTATGRTPGQA